MVRPACIAPKRIRSALAFRACLALTFLGAALFCGGSLPAQERKLLFDFEQGSLSNQWSAVGEIRVQREILDPAQLPKHAAGDQFAPAGKGIEVTTKGQSGVITKTAQVDCAWPTVSQIELWVFRPNPQSEKSTDGTKGNAPKHGKDIDVIEVRLYEKDNKSRFWRKIEMDHHGWKKLSLPLKWFRWSRGPIPRVDRIDRIGFWFRDTARVQIDSIVAVTNSDQPPRTSFFRGADIKPIAFAGESPKSIREFAQGKTHVLTNAPDLDGRRLVEHLEKVRRQSQADIPVLKEPAQPIPLLVFKSREQYRKFPARLAELLNSEVGGARSAGFTMLGVAMSYWSPEHGSLRPVYTHEYVHALTTRVLRIDNQQDWLHEGLAVSYQLRFHPQDNLKQIVGQGLESSRRRLPLAVLCNGRPIPANRYWQAMTVIEMLLRDGKYREYAPQLLQAFQQTGSTDLQAHLKSVLKTNWKTFNEHWRSYCEQTYLK